MAAALIGMAPAGVSIAAAQEAAANPQEGLAYVGEVTAERVEADLSAAPLMIPIVIEQTLEQDDINLRFGAAWRDVAWRGDLRQVSLVANVRQSNGDNYFGGSLCGEVVSDDRLAGSVCINYSDQENNLFQERNGLNVSGEGAFRLFGRTAFGARFQSNEGGDGQAAELGLRTDFGVGSLDGRLEVSIGQSEGETYRGIAGVEELETDRRSIRLTIRPHRELPANSSLLPVMGPFAEVAYLEEEGRIGHPLLGPANHDVQAVMAKLGVRF